MATVEGLARKIRIYVDAHSELGKVSGSDSRFDIASQRTGDALVSSLWRHVSRQIIESGETEPAQRPSRGGMLKVQAGTMLLTGANVHARGVDGIGRGKADKGRARGLPSAEAWSRRQQNDESTGPNAGFSGGVAVGLRNSGGIDVALFCASAKRSQLLPEVFDDCSLVRRWLSPRDRAIIRELNECVFADNFVETDGISCSEVTPNRPQTCHHQHLTVSFLSFLTSDHQAGLNPARQFFGDCSRVVPSEVVH